MQSNNVPTIPEKPLYKSSAQTLYLKTALSNTRLDRIEFKSGLSTPDAGYASLVLPDLLSIIFGVGSVRGTPSGYLKAGNHYSFGTNGARLYRAFKGLPTPSVPKNLRNQFTKEELLSTGFNAHLDHQIDLYTEAFSQLLRFLNPRCRHLCIAQPLRFNRIEFYREYLLPHDKEAFIQQVKRSTCRLFGQPMKKGQKIIEETSQIENKAEGFVASWKLSVSTRGKAKETFLKCYQKGTRMRIEVWFSGASAEEVPLTDMRGEYFDDISRAIKKLLASLHGVAESILNEVQSTMDSRVPTFDKSELLAKMKELGVRGSNKKIDLLIKALDDDGIYDPSSLPVKERLGRSTLRLLSESSDLLKKKSILNSAKKPKKNFYILNPNWGEVQRVPKVIETNPGILIAPNIHRIFKRTAVDFLELPDEWFPFYIKRNKSEDVLARKGTSP